MSAASIAAAIDRTRSRRARTTAPIGSAVAYLRVSTDEQAESGAGFAAQRSAIEAVAAVRGWTITAWHEDGGVSGGKAPHQRPGLAGALDAVQTGQAERLIVAKIDRLSRRFRDAVDLMETADEGWPLYIADIDADLTTSNGRLVARMLAAISEDERDRIRQRTKAALAAKKAAGVRLGRPATLPAELVARIVTDRASGVSFGKIAAALNADGVPTAQGGKRWYPATVKAVVSGQDAAQMRAEK